MCLNMLVKKAKLIGVAGTIVLYCLSVNLCAMQQQMITLKAGDEKGLEKMVPRRVADLSVTLKNLLEDLPTANTAPIPLPNIRSEVLEAVVLLMNGLYGKNLTWQEKLDLINKASGRFSWRLFPWQSSPVYFAELFLALNYLDVQGLEAPLAYLIVQSLHNDYKGDRNLVEWAIRKILGQEDRIITMYLNREERARENKLAQRALGSAEYMHLSREGSGALPEFAALLAKYWYLNYGNAEERDYIFPELDYGFSIEELRFYGKLTKNIRRTVERMHKDVACQYVKILELDLSNLRINDITGLSTLLNIAVTGRSLYGYERINLSNNRLTNAQIMDLRLRLPRIEIKY